MPKVWWNTGQTLGTYRHTSGSSAELPKVSWFNQITTNDQGKYYIIMYGNNGLVVYNTDSHNS